MLAAGSGERYRRVSGEFKLLAPLADGRPIIRATCETAIAAASRVVVVGRCELPEVERALAGLPIELIACPAAVHGPGAAIRAGVNAVPPDHAILIFLADMPFTAGQTVTMVQTALRSGAALARPVYEGVPGHPVGFAPEFRQALLMLRPSQGAAPLLRLHQDRLQLISVDDPGCVRDIDEPEDLSR